MKHPQPYSDTDPRAMEVWLDLLRRMPAGKKIESVFALSRMAIQFSEAGVRMAYPEADDREVFLRTAARRLSRDLMIQVYGWDPRAHDRLRRTALSESSKFWTCSKSLTSWWDLWPVPYTESLAPLWTSTW